MRRTWTVAIGIGLGLATWMGCADDSSGGGSSCGSDDDCKGDRVCEQGACVDPGAGGGGLAGGAAGGVGGAATPSECLTEVKCANQLDCPAGHHCNTALEVPHCQELYCGATGTSCSSTELCQTGQLCIDEACAPAPACDNCCDDGLSCYGYAAETLFTVLGDNPPCLSWESLPEWTAMRDCVCSACAADCQSWCATGLHEPDPYFCLQCVQMHSGNSGYPRAACEAQTAACNGG